MWWALWHGGASYAVSTADDAEPFSSLRAAGRELWHRECSGDPYYPCVEDSEMWLYWAPKGTPREDLAFDYPDRIATIGPRGGIRIERT